MNLIKKCQKTVFYLCFAPTFCRAKRMYFFNISIGMRSKSDCNITSSASRSFSKSIEFSTIFVFPILTYHQPAGDVSYAIGGQIGLTVRPALGQRCPGQHRERQNGTKLVPLDLHYPRM